MYVQWHWSSLTYFVKACFISSPLPLFSTLWSSAPALPPRQPLQLPAGCLEGKAGALREKAGFPGSLSSPLAEGACHSASSLPPLQLELSPGSEFQVEAENRLDPELLP